MKLSEKLLYHQVHPAKLATDFGTAAVSLYFFWQHALFLALAVHILPSVLASGALIRWAPLEGYKQSELGAYLRRYMTRAWEAVRFAGDIVMALGAWWHRPAFIALGLLVIAGAWANGLMRGGDV
jgi:hypothetical protein